MSDCLIKIDGRGLEPHLEAFMFSILDQIQKGQSAAIKTQIALVDRQIQLARLCATASDERGIAMAPPAAESFLKNDAPVIALRLAPGVKPAISGLGVVASGDHRLGRF